MRGIAMGALDGRIVIITGAGRGLGREHALLFAQEGAKVVVNDLGGDIHGEGADRAPAQQVVDEIEKMGGEAVANVDSAADWEGAQRLIRTAIDTFGDLHVLVNNAGILRDRVIVNMTEEEWDAVIHVHLKGHFCPTRHAAAYWREQSKAGKEVKASIVNTSSTSCSATRARPTTARPSRASRRSRTSRHSSSGATASGPTRSLPPPAPD
jgi:NAD(P)-dependent dehydrogenase (short-subunit alcohol dehydrogenase family)